MRIREGCGVIRRIRMKYILWILFALAVTDAVPAPMPAVAEERQAEISEAAASAKAKLGDEVACAVDGMKMQLQADTPSAEYRGKVYYFCSEAERQTFLQQPERFVHK
jgi:YHS domain-containing protein